MEQNKTYIIILVVTLVAAGLIAAGLYLFSPAPGTISSPSKAQTRQFNPYSYVRDEAYVSSESEDRADPGDFEIEQGVSEASTGEESSLVYKQNNVYGLNSEALVPLRSKTSGTEHSSDVIAGDDFRYSSVGSQLDGTILDNSASKPKPSSVGSRGSSGAVATANRTENGSNRTTTPDGNTQSGNSAPEIARPTEYCEYWIQIMASTSLDRLETARDELLTHGLGGRISTLDRGGRLYYRLRYGPFQVREEAEKFLNWIKNLEKYSASYISLEYHLRG